MISICIPTYEQRGYGSRMLRELLNSIKSQTINYPYEIVISDNSKDHSIKNLCDRYKDLPIRYVHNPVIGASENINNAINEAKYDMIKIMCQDDRFNDTNAINLFVEQLKISGWVISNSVRIDDRNMRKGFATAKYIHGDFSSNKVGMPSVIGFNKCEVRFDTRLKTFCDLYFYYQLYELYGKPAHIEKHTVAQRYWRGSLSRNQPGSHNADRQFLIENRLIKMPEKKIVVAVCVHDRIYNVQRWIDSWRESNTVKAKLIIIHNTTDSDEIIFDDASVEYISRPNIGYDIGAFQDVVKERLPGFPNDWDYLLWCADDTVPMTKDFISPFINSFEDDKVAVTCMQVSKEVRTHIRTTGFCISKQFSKLLTFPADPITTKEQCYQFEHRDIKNSFLRQVARHKMRVVQVADYKDSPLYDLNYWKRNKQAMSQKSTLFREDLVFGYNNHEKYEPMKNELQEPSTM